MTSPFSAALRNPFRNPTRHITYRSLVPTTSNLLQKKEPPRFKAKRVLHSRLTFVPAGRRKLYRGVLFGDGDEPHAGFVHGRIEELRVFGSEVSLGLVLKYAQ